MRQFIIIGHDAPTTPDFSLDNIPGAGRLDVLCRCLTSAFLLSHGLRENVRVFLVLSGEFTLRLEGRELRQFHPDERSTAARIRNALEQREEAIGHMEVETSPGIYLSRLGFEDVLDRASQDGVVFQLHEKGTPAIDLDPPSDPVFVLSDHQDFTAEQDQLLAEVRDRAVTLGPERLHADQAITVAHNWLDTAGFDAY